MGSQGKLRLKRAAIAATVLAVAAGCARHEGHLGENLVRASTGGAVDKLIGQSTLDGKEQFRVLNGGGLAAALASGEILAPSSEEAARVLRRTPGAESLSAKAARAALSGKRATKNAAADAERDEAPKASDESLLVGFPIGLIGERQVFGGVVTKVSDRSSEDLGILKLADLPPIHVRTIVANGAEEGQPPEYAVFLVGCVSKCEEGSDEVPLLGFPIVGVDERNGLAILDVAPAGKELNIMDAIDPIGLQTGYKTEAVKAVAVDYSTATLVFDVESTMKKLFAAPNDPPPVRPLVITARWYLRLASTFASDFEARSPVPGVGFFTTERSKTTRITRFRKPSAVKGSNAPVGVKYYVKNVPLEYRKAFAAGFEQWNTAFKTITGKPILTYEFVDAGTPESEALVTGDIRYNILEWDLDNLAPYGGLGPSIANQFTGELLSGNVLIQGPTIVELYSRWFGVGQDVVREHEIGAIARANDRHVELVKELARRIPEPKSKFVVKMTEGIEMRVPAQMDALKDPIAAQKDFDLPPQGLTYADYMDGYFVELVAHELGHNLGLRHNFFGNLGSTDDMTEASVSRSIMEYLSRPFRHLNRVRDYDKMAVAYGYTGKLPEVTNHFCTDENVANPGKRDNSAECSRDDATSDPYGFLSARFAKAIDLLTNAGATERPSWTLPDVRRVLSTTSLNMGLYALSAEGTAAKWTNFFGKPGRPKNGEGVKEFVYATVKQQLCGKRIEDALAGKTGEALETAKANVEEARKLVKELFTEIGLVEKAPEGDDSAGGDEGEGDTEVEAKADPLTCEA
jgi:hypothetical protein